MSANSGGPEAPGDLITGNLPGNSEEAANAARRLLVSRKRDVELCFLQDVAVGSVVDAIILAVGSPQQLECIQLISPKKFLVSFRSVESAEFFHRVSAPALCVTGARPTSRWLGSERKRLRVSFLPNAVPNTELVNALEKYGRVIQVTDETYANRPVCIKTGTRLVDMDMIRAVPNILTVCGFSVPVTYRGVVTQCRRCQQSGHLKADCKTPFCDRCRSFGHSCTDCSAPCLKCRSPGHHWRECSVRSYAFVAARNAGDQTQTEAASSVLNPKMDLPPGEAFHTVAEIDSASAAIEPIICAPPGQDLENADITVSVEDAYDSASEGGSELDGLSTSSRLETTPTAGAKDSDVQATCKQTGTFCSGNESSWQNAKHRTNKRKKASLNAEKSPDPKKPARSSPVKHT